MCCKTKMKIASALNELMQEYPLKKITVQDIMDRTHMKRQSFYYHFQDIYDVLEWETQHRLEELLRYDPEQSYEDWCMSVLCGLNADRSFYRKVFSALDVQQILNRCEPLARPITCRLLLGSTIEDESVLSDEQRFMIGFFTRSICRELLNHVVNRVPLDETRSRRYIQTICRIAPYRI